MPVDPEEADRLVHDLTAVYSGNYTFEEWIASTAMLQTIGFGKDPADIPMGDEWKDFVRWNTMAAVAELGEFLDEVPWKPWASNLELNRDAAIGELVDAMHFIGNILQLLMVTGPELTAAYKNKQLKNLRRQVVGYDGKKEKCGYCHRELDGSDVSSTEVYQLYPGIKFCNKDHADKYKEKMH
jgi:hypothetical protein